MKPRLSYAEAFPHKAAAAADVAHKGASNLLRDVAAWHPKRGSADADLLPDLSQLVGRQRDIERNNGVAKGGTQTIIDNVVGTGLRLSARPDAALLKWSPEKAREWKRAVQSRFHAYWWSTACHAGDTMTGDQMTAQQMRYMIGGEFVALPLWIPNRGDGFATKFQTIEPDRLSQPDGTPETTNFRGGIEFDDYGAPVRYHIRRRHPGDPYQNATLFGWEAIDRRFPSGRLRVIHGFDPERSGQSRGKPLLSSVLSQFKQIDRYTNAEIMAAVVNAMVAMVVETPMSSEDIADLFGTVEDRDFYLQARQDHANVGLGSGAIIPLFPGDKASSFLPQRPATGFGQFVENIFRIIAVGMDMPYELLMKDFSKTNYSSARAAMLEAWRSFTRRREWLGTQWMDPVFALWFEEQVHAGAIEAPGFIEDPTLRRAYLRCRWIGPGRGWVDPVKEADAAGIRMDNLLSTLEDECAEQGKDYEEVLDQLELEAAILKEKGLTAKRAPRSVDPYPSDREDEQAQRGNDREGRREDAVA